MEFIPNLEGMAQIEVKVRQNLMASAQPQIDQLAAGSRGATVDAIVPELEAILGAHGLQVPDPTVLAFATAMSDGDPVSLV
jgi:hypothetical protein